MIGRKMETGMGGEGVDTNMYINQGGLTALSSLVNKEKRAAVSLQ